MNNKIYATNGKPGKKNIRKLRIQHWAPGKKFQSGCPIPSFLVKEAKRMKSKRLIYAEVAIKQETITNPESIAEDYAEQKEKPHMLARRIYPETLIVSAWLFCRKKDTVDIDNGIALTISRLAVALHKADTGWELSL